MKNKKNLLEKRLLYPLSSFLFSIVLCAVIFSSKGIAPFGPRTLFMSDLGAQYMPFLSYYQRAVARNEGFLYSFQNGIGGNMIPLFAYYLTSPLNALTLLFSTATLPIAVSMLIMLKIGLAGAAMCWHLLKAYQKESPIAVLLSMAYAFSGFAAAYFYNIMWLDVLIWLPLVVSALQLLLEKGRAVPYILALAGTIGSNFYLGYMVCLFLVLYFFYWIGKNRGSKTWLQSWKEYRLAFLKFALSSLTAAAMLALLLIPTAIGMMQTGKSEFDASVFLPIPLYGLDGLAGLGLGVSNFSSRLHHLPTFYIGLFVLVLACTHFFNQRISKLERKTSAVFLVVLWLCTWFQPFVVAFQMFQRAAGFPFRNAFLVSFFLILLAYESWLEREGIAEHVIWKSSFVLIAGFLVAFIFNRWTQPLTRYPEMKGMTLLLNLLFTGAACLWFVFFLKEKQIGKGWAGAAAVLLLLELGLNFGLTMAGAEFGNLKSYQTYVKEYEKALAELPEQEKPFVRISNDSLSARDFGVASNGYNEGFLLGYNGVTAYTSTLANESLDLYKNLGLYSWNERRISYMGNTSLTDLLLNVGYSLEENEGAMELQSTRHTKGIGFLAPKEIEEAEMKEDQPFQNQNEIFQKLFQTKEPVFKSIAAFESEKIKNDLHEIQLETAEAGRLYVWLPRQRKSIRTLEVDGQAAEHKFVLNNATLLPLGDFQKGETVRVTASIPLDASHFQVFDNALFEKELDNLEADSLEVLSWRNAKILGETTAQANQLLFLSIPYDEGWQASIEGKPVPVKKIWGGLMGIETGAGKQTVKLTYVPAGYTSGKLLSAAGWLFFLLWAFQEFRRKQN